jgi:hypothetical protein
MDRPPNFSSIPVGYRDSTSNVLGGNSGHALNRPMGQIQGSQSHPHSQSQPQQNNTQPHPPAQQRAGLPQYSPYSTQGPFQTLNFVSENFMLGAGAVIIQPSSQKVVIVQDGNRWFLPKGRKDLGEPIEQAALREAYEEVRISTVSVSRSHGGSPSHSLATDANSCLSITGRTPSRVTSGLQK